MEQRANHKKVRIASSQVIVVMVWTDVQGVVSVA